MTRAATAGAARLAQPLHNTIDFQPINQIGGIRLLIKECDSELVGIGGELPIMHTMHLVIEIVGS
jgi:hypothetical protein